MQNFLFFFAKKEALGKQEQIKENHLPQEMVFFLFMLGIIDFFAVEQCTDKHDHDKDDQIEKHGEREFSLCCCLTVRLEPVCVKRNEYHKERGENAQERHNHILENILLPFSYHKHNKNRNIERIDRNDRKLRGVKAERSEHGIRQICAVEVEVPRTAEKKCQNARIGGHIRLVLNGSKHFGLGPHSRTAME